MKKKTLLGVLPGFTGLQFNRETIIEVKNSIKEAIAGYLEVLASMNQAIPLPQFVARRDFFQPEINGGFFLSQSARPQAVDENASAIISGGRIVNAFNSDFYQKMHAPALVKVNYILYIYLVILKYSF